MFGKSSIIILEANIKAPSIEITHISLTLKPRDADLYSDIGIT